MDPLRIDSARTPAGTVLSLARPFEIVRGPDPVHRGFVLTRLEDRLRFVDAPGATGGEGAG